MVLRPGLAALIVSALTLASCTIPLPYHTASGSRHCEHQTGSLVCQPGDEAPELSTGSGGPGVQGQGQPGQTPGGATGN